MVKFKEPVGGLDPFSSSTFHTAFADGERWILSGIPKHDFVPRSSDGFSPAERIHRDHRCDNTVPTIQYSVTTECT